MTASSFAPLHRGFLDAAGRFAERTAVVDPGHGLLSYADLNALSARVRDRLAQLGVGPGDRVGLYLRKCADTVAAIYGILRAGAAYVPVDSGAPVERNAYVFHNCEVQVLIAEARVLDAVRAQFETLGRTPVLVGLEDVGGAKGLTRWLDTADRAGSAPTVPDHASKPDDVAYILYTSGSTGRPKGVTLTHENAVSFVQWCSETFEPHERDVFSSHAPFHFDLSVLDLFVSHRHGAALVLIGEEAGKEPTGLIKLIAEHRISVWYSAPSILSLLAQFGSLDKHPVPDLRHVFFAGEVFPIKHLRRLAELWPTPRYFNLYGPTETNVCTFYEVKLPIAAEQNTPFPIGKVCSHLRGKVVDEDGRQVAEGQEGELCITGRGVMQRYWGLPEQTLKGFLTDQNGERWYRTGDIVFQDANGDYVYKGRRDRMVKRRAYRVELGEIEAGLYKHAQIKEAAVIAIPDEEAGVKIIAHVSSRTGAPLSLIEMKGFCAQVLPMYMIPDRFQWHAALPKTSTDKIHYQQLKEMS